MSTTLDAVHLGSRFATELPELSLAWKAEEAPEPLASEFRITFDEQKFGLPFEEALLGLGDRVEVVDVKILITAILVQREVGPIERLYTTFDLAYHTPAQFLGTVSQPAAAPPAASTESDEEKAAKRALWQRI